MRERGNYPGPNAGPKGMVVHFTAGRWEKKLASALQSIAGGIKDGYTFLCIACTGELVQAHNVLKYGYHAGESAWRVKLKRLPWSIVGSVSDGFIGVEMNNAGKVDRVVNSKTKQITYKTWFDQTLTEDQVRYVQEKDGRIYNGEFYAWGCPTGHYHKYSAEQEETLIRTILWLYVNCEDFKLEYVVGHHEVAGKLGIGYWRKNDPGGALSMPMEMLRAKLMTEKSELIAKYGIKKEAR